jgi:MFS family permease
MALTTYVGRLAPANEKTMTLSMGVAMNHIASVTMPLVGGLVWKYFGYRWTFLIGSVAAAASIFAAVRVPKHIRAVPVAATELQIASAVTSPIPGGEPE